jgi:signal transduction histidine kinase/CheY-like chemotaxis protein
MHDPEPDRAAAANAGSPSPAQAPRRLGLIAAAPIGIGALAVALGIAAFGARDWLAVWLAALAVSAGALAALALLAWRSAAAHQAKAEQEACDARAAAAESELAKSRFLAAAGHDLRQPLHALTLYISALKRRVTGAEALDILAKTERAAQSLAGMFATLLDLARVQANAAHVDLANIALQDSLARAVAEFPGGAVAAHGAPSALRVRSDAEMFERLLRRLVSNALIHGGGAAEISVAVAGGRAVVTVADQGPGIAAEDQERMFDEFVRLDARPGADGLGLGLAIVRRIALLIEAEITVQSAPGEGARFSVSVPLAPGVAMPTAAPPAPDAALAGARIAAIDDQPLVLAAAAQAMRDAGAEVRTGDGEAALRALFADGWTPHAIVTDYRLGGVMCGSAAAVAASALLDPAPAILIVTGDTAPDTLQTLRGLGLPWLVKPVSPEELTSTVRALIANSI